MYYYVSHLTGTIFSSPTIRSYEQRYCEVCGDSDNYLGFFNTEEEAKAAWEKEYNSHYEEEEEE